MLDSVSVDQLRTFLAAADAGSFSAAGRRLRRAQSVVSQTLATLEARLGVPLFDRSRRLPRVTEQGRVLLPQVRSVVAAMDAFKAQAKGLSEGLEPEVAITVDVLFPMAVVTRAVAAFQVAFPDTPLRLYVEALGAVLEPVRDGRCAFGVMGSFAEDVPDLVSEPVLGVPMCVAVAPRHPLAAIAGPIPAELLKTQIQLVLTDRSSLSLGREFGVMSERTWRLADLGAKHAFLRAGLGWGAMPRDAVAADLASGDLVEIDIEGLNPAHFVMRMLAVYAAARPPGRAGRWLLECLCARPIAPRSIVRHFASRDLVPRATR